MEINPAASSATQSNAQSNSNRSLTGLADNLDNFLTILTTQLQHQDPLSPLDTHEFTNQLVLFAGVEQDIQGNSSLEKLIALQQNNVAVGAVSYIGQNIDATGQTNMLRNGEAKFGYTLPGNAKSATVQISDASGKPILVAPAQTTAGRHEFTWDGNDSLGNLVPEGPYSITVLAADAADQPMPVTYSVSGRVTGVEMTNGDATLNLGDVIIPLTQVTRIREANDAASTP
ncbi:MAG: flagellar hook assembly protein FlgD [Alphaproteobacteria bacterium]|nr:flagellar hook assembly protein FlgD [Alphaproteobacteria bacterium]